jgi:FMNH2-dependent dimethyl sulfone monooxygenase
VEVNFFDFEPDLAYFGEAVVPLMHQAGLRIADEPAREKATPPKPKPRRKA